MINDPGDLLGNSAVMPTRGDRAVRPLTAREISTPDNGSRSEGGTHDRASPESPWADHEPILAAWHAVLADVLVARFAI